MIILFLAKILTNIFGIDLQKAQRLVVWLLLAVGVVIFLVVFGLVYRSCSKSPKLDQKEIIQAQQAIEKEDRKTMIEVLTNSDVREQAIESNIKAAENATAEAKQNYSGKSNEELAAELEKRLNESH